ncbi:MAG: amidohydrolase, partial [Burkholderiaceae bacterium]|nr:amidohydrolase [Burkholderiaceae bacterium]
MNAPAPLSRREFLALAGSLAASAAAGCSQRGGAGAGPPPAEVLIHNARITTLDPARPEASACAVHGGRFVAVGEEAEVLAWRGASTTVIDAGGRRIIPG